MNYGYIRVSTEEQNLDNQKNAILEQFQIDEWVEEKKSGTIDFHKRNLGGLLDKLKEGDTLVITELSRLGRSISMIFEIISELKKKKVHCVAIKNNFDLNPDNNNDVITSVILFAFGLSAQIERQLISERTRLGLKTAKENGKRIGRQKGETIYNVKLRPYQKEIMEAFKKGKSVNSLANYYKVKWTTMKRFVTFYSKMKPPKPLTERPKKHGHPTIAEIEWYKNHA